MPDAWGLLAAAVRTEPARPFLTMYDDATGERVELSVVTFANWVAKTANLLVDELMVEPDEPVRVALPAHWQTAVVELAVRCVPARLAAGDEPARVAFWAEGDTLPADAEEVVGLSLRPLTAGLREPRPGVLDYSREVLAFGDQFAPVQPGPPVAVEPVADRVLTDALDLLLPALAGGGSLVLVRNADPAQLDRRAAAEHCTRIVLNSGFR